LKCGFVDFAEGFQELSGAGSAFVGFHVQRDAYAHFPTVDFYVCSHEGSFRAGRALHTAGFASPVPGVAWAGVGGCVVASPPVGLARWVPVLLRVSMVVTASVSACRSIAPVCLLPLQIGDKQRAVCRLARRGRCSYA